MKPRLYGIWGCLGLALTLAGCEPPDDIIPTAPPGAVIPRTPPDADHPAEAQGEAAVAPNPAGEGKSKPAPYTPAPPTAKGETKTTKNGVKYQTLKEGTGPELKPGRVAQFHYEGKLVDGTVFDSSHLKNQPANFTLGTNGLIRGWEEGLPGMRVGETRKLWVPAAMGYGAQGKGQIPPNADLEFEVELLKIFE